jgi:hypothetical protein
VKSIGELPSITFERAITLSTSDMTMEEIASFGSFLRAAFIYDLEERPTAEKLAKHPWLNET